MKPVEMICVDCRKIKSLCFCPQAQRRDIKKDIPFDGSGISEPTIIKGSYKKGSLKDRETEQRSNSE